MTPESGQVRTLQQILPLGRFFKELRNFAMFSVGFDFCLVFSMVKWTKLTAYPSGDKLTDHPLKKLPVVPVAPICSLRFIFGGTSEG